MNIGPRKDEDEMLLMYEGCQHSQQVLVDGAIEAPQHNDFFGKALLYVLGTFFSAIATSVLDV